LAAVSSSMHDALHHDITLDRLFGALPELSELAVLRHALLSASVVDLTRLWSHSNAYATYDKRILSPTALERALASAAATAHARVEELYKAVARMLAALISNDLAGAALELLRVGEQLQADENPSAALAWYEAAERLAAQAGQHELRARALRYRALLHVNRGAPEEASAAYRASLEVAAAARDQEGQVVALTGLGIVLGYQGRSGDALMHFRTALDLCADQFPRRRAQLLINVAALLAEEGDHAEASSKLAEASALWSYLTDADRCGWYNSRGSLALHRGELEMAEGIFHQALESAQSEFERAMVLDNLAELFIRQGNLSEAEALARSAEEAALRSAAPQAIAQIYIRLGKIFRLRGDANGVTFFEKALEICRQRSYPHTEANAYLEYGHFRRLHGDIEEARTHFERARQLFRALGAARLERTASHQLAHI
jgi:tetratricopeptide (TPR) repeat protein